MDIQTLMNHSWLGLDDESIELAKKVLAVVSTQREGLNPASESEFKNFLDAESARTGSARLFGTSGIRGLFREDGPGNPVDAFVQDGYITPRLVYFTGRALGRLMRELHYRDIAHVFMDSRLSSMALAQTMCMGLADEGISFSFGGVAPTPCYCLLSPWMVIIITASHNPSDYNGIKVFWQGSPMVRKHEKYVEGVIRAQAAMFSIGKYIPPESAEIMVIPGLPELEKRHFSLLYNLPATAQLRVGTKIRLESRFLPLDLAYGSAACPPGKNGSILRLSPPLAMFMSLGIPVIGYGCIQHSRRLNHRIGAAYAYGETPYQPRQDELSKFARGQPGYGGRTPRMAFLPEQFVSGHSQISSAIQSIPPSGSVQKIPIGFPDFQGAAYVVPLDKRNMHSTLVTAIETYIMKVEPLPGLMVDGDADRILITSPDLSKKETPFMTGDGLIRFFAETAPHETYDEVVYTVESGIALEKALQAMQEQSAKSGKRPFEIRSVTVGDRAIIDYFLDRCKGHMLGGEPSGHILFGEMIHQEMRIIDDPFVTYLRFLDRLSGERFHLDALFGRMFWSIPEVYCARKPDSRAGTGVSLEEKLKLEMWDASDSKQVSHYARHFLPAYIEMFASIYSDAFLDSVPFEIAFTWEWERLIESQLQPSDWDEDMKIASITFGEAEVIEELEVGLHLDRREWAGPEVIRVGFFVAFEGSMIKMGEGVFRNSGTSPKNSGYHKLWPIHPFRGMTISEGRLRVLLDQLASRRAAWTDTYIQSELRS